MPWRALSVVPSLHLRDPPPRERRRNDSAVDCRCFGKFLGGDSDGVDEKKYSLVMNERPPGLNALFYFKSLYINSRFVL